MKLFASEIQPAATRASATSLCQSANCVRPFILLVFLQLYNSITANTLSQISNFFVAFITPVLLARSSSGVYFLFGGSSFLTVAVCIMYMPETEGRDLETIGETFGLLKVADMPLIRGLTSLTSRVGKKVGIQRGPSGHASLAENREIELESRR